MPTAIPYCDEVWNPVVGCRAMGSGCYNCWAKRLHDKRHAAYKDGKHMPEQYSRPFWHIQRISKRLDWPKTKWKVKPRTIFVCSTSDLFCGQVPFEYVDLVFSTIMSCPQHTFLIFTKRFKRAWEYFEGVAKDQTESGEPNPFPLPNIKFFVSVSKQAELREAMKFLPFIPSVYHGLSIEPILEQINLHEMCVSPLGEHIYQPIYRFLDGVVVGCEKAPRNVIRPADIQWFHSLREQIKAEKKRPKTKLYIKQIPDKDYPKKVLTEPKDFPKNLRMRDL